jgi:hypothetical protein
MDLHCWRDDCATRKITYRPHMGVLTRSNEQWECWDYHLPFQHKNRWYCLEGKQKKIEIKVQDQVIGEITSGSTKIHQISRDTDPQVYINPRGIAKPFSVSFDAKPPLIDLDFISLPTGDEMHEEAERLFNRLMKLVPFT